MSRGLQKNSETSCCPTRVKFSEQYPTLALRTSSEFHDRFLILDGTELYQIGASLKDVGRRCFAIAQLEALFIPLILKRL